MKPDHGITGGFEGVLGPIVDHLRESGHRVDLVGVDVTSTRAEPFGIPVPAGARPTYDDCIAYFSLIEQFRELRLARADVIVSTQPPSFAARHPRHLSLFYHHQRAYYDLADVAMEAGMVDRETHPIALARVRAVDQGLLDDVTHFLAGSAEVAGRLAKFNGFRENVGVFEAGFSSSDELPEPRGSDVFDSPLCVSRSEFPKRTELFVQAIGLLGLDAPADLVGSGGRLGWVEHLLSEMAAGAIDPHAMGPRDTWLCQPGYIPPSGSTEPRFAVRLHGRVDDATLDRLYRQACCVVAPAYLEDYGLTALEAMAYGKPVIVCRDGGGLTAFVQHEVTGLVVEPTARAIADAVQRFRSDASYARALGDAGREAVRAYTWQRALAQFDDALKRVAS